MSVADKASERGISEILHYTSERGVMGAIRKNAVLSRKRVQDDPEVTYIFQGVWPRKDVDFLDYISLSVSRINLDLFDRSRKHFPDWWWAVLSFEIEILDHTGVIFTTTNNIYPPCERGEELEGFEAMFDEPIEWGYHGSRRYRHNKPDSYTTDRAAEVLYPGELSLAHLRKIYVLSDQARRLVRAWCEVFGTPVYDVEVSATAFT